VHDVVNGKLTSAPISKWNERTWDENREELKRQEIIIGTETGKALESTLKIANALRVIRDEQLYRIGHGTLQKYVSKRFRFSKARLYQISSLGQVFTNLGMDIEESTSSRLAILTESSFRPMYRLEPKQQQAAWEVINPEACG
jgi:hypothetical protein